MAGWGPGFRRDDGSVGAGGVGMSGRRKRAGVVWRRRFLKAMARTANARLSGDMAGIDHTTAYQLRDRDPGFAAAWVRAREWGRERVRAEGRPVFAGGRPRPARAGEAPPDPRALIARRSKRGEAQIVRVGEGRMTPEDEETFFVHLAAGFGVRHSARVIGFSTTALYSRKRKDPAFEARWKQAREEGLERNDSLLIDAVPLALDPEIIAAVEDAPRPSIAEAIRIVSLYRPRGSSGGGGRNVPPAPSIEAVRDDVLERLRAIRRHRAAEGGGGEGEGTGGDEGE